MLLRPGGRDNAKRAPPGTSVSGRDPSQRFLVVREGGVEPPRPCGHWNLNPARLPIPPPAHWVLSSGLPPPPGGCGAFRHENISTLAGVDSHPFPQPRRRPPLSSTTVPGVRPRAFRRAPSGRGRTPPAAVRRRPSPTSPSRNVGPPCAPAAFRERLLHVSTSYRSSSSAQEPGGVHSPVRDTGLRPPLRSMAETARTRATAGLQEFEGVSRRERRQASTPVDGGYQGEPADRAARGYDQ